MAVRILHAASVERSDELLLCSAASINLVSTGAKDLYSTAYEQKLIPNREPFCCCKMSSDEGHGRVELRKPFHALCTRISNHEAGYSRLSSQSQSRCSQDIKIAVTQPQKHGTEINNVPLKDDPILQLDELLYDQERGSSRPSLLEQWWLLEWLFCLVSVLTMVAIIIILGKYDHQPLPNWPRHITINSLISVLGTTSKAMMLITVSAGGY